MKSESQLKYQALYPSFFEKPEAERYVVWRTNPDPIKRGVSKYVFAALSKMGGAPGGNVENIAAWLLYRIHFKDYGGALRYLEKKKDAVCSRSDGIYQKLRNDLADDVRRVRLMEEHSIEAVRDRIKIDNVIMDSLIEVRVVHTVPFFWNSIRSMVISFSRMKDVNVVVVVGDESHKDWIAECEAQVKSVGANAVAMTEYNIAGDKPDIIIFNIAHTDSPYIDLGGNETIRENAEYVAVVPYDNTQKSHDDGFVEMYSRIRSLRYDLLVSAPTTYPIISKHYDNVICMANPKFDSIYEKLQKTQDGRFDKLSGKRIILWATTHGHEDDGHFNQAVCFDQYIKDMLDWFKERPGMGLIFRPHPMLVEEYAHLHHIWSVNDLIRIKEYFKRSENLIWDDSSDYSAAFAASDALLVDSLTGIQFSYLPTGKPICVSYRNKYELRGYNSELTENYYKAYDWDGIVEYFQMVSDGKDPLCDVRMKTKEKFIPQFDGKSGERIADKIIAEFKKRKNRDGVNS